MERSRKKIPQAQQKRLLRLISAQTDMEYASDAFQRCMATNDKGARGHYFLAMVLAYCRPFTENYGVGSLLCEYPSFPDFANDGMNLRHRRMMDLRNKFLGHSSIEGTRVYLLAPGSRSPKSQKTAIGYGYAVEKLIFSEETGFVQELHDVVKALSDRIAGDIRVVAREVGSRYLKDGEIYTIDTGKKAFKWTQ